jgi:Cys-tRNA synthase (O-phospho-L-seryl-tRNA:Cys-tRNA synthase)
MAKNFDDIITEIRAIKPRVEILLEEVPAPQKLAPFAFAMTADVLEDAATGRFVLLHDPDGQEGWSGNLRCVTFVRAAIDNEMAADPMLCNIGWTWLMESLKVNGCDFTAPSGTVTKVASASFGTLENLEEDSELEVRASWTPTSGENIASHIKAWVELLEMSAGLAPIPDGVTQLSRSR